MKNSVLILFVAFFSYSCATFDFKVAEIKDFPADMVDPATVTQDKYPDESGVIIYHKNDYLIEKVENGHVFVKVKLRYIEKIFSAKTYTRSNHLFMDSYGTLTFVSGRIIRKNGEVQHLPVKDFFEQTEELRYMDERKKEKKVLFSDIKTEDGDIVDKEYEFYIKKPFSYEVALIVDSHMPIVQRFVSITVPENFSEINSGKWFFKFHYINGKTSPVQTKGNGFNTVSIKESQLKANQTEGMTEFNNENRKILFFSVSTFKDWDDAAEQYYSYYVLPAMKRSDPQKIKELALKITSGAKNRTDKIIKTVRFVKDIEDDDLKNRYGDIYFLLPPSVTAQTLRATMTDKALLLKSLLDANDIKAELVFINERYGYKLNKDFPALLYFRSMVVRVAAPDDPHGWIYLDPDNRNNHELFFSYTYCGTYGLRIGENIKDGLVTTPEYSFDDSPEIEETVKIKMIDLTKASFEGEIAANKMFFSNFSKLDNMNRKKAEEAIVDFLFQNEDMVFLKSFRTSYHNGGSVVKINFEGEMTLQIIKKEHRFIFIPNNVKTSFFSPLFKASEKRTSPIFLGRKRKIISNWTATLPPGYSFGNMSVEKENSVAGVLSNKIKIIRNSTVSTTIDEITYTGSFIDPDQEKEYANYLYNLYTFSEYIDFEKEGGNE